MLNFSKNAKKRENIAEIETLINGLETIGINSSIPKYAIGFSGGGAFLSLMVHEVDVDGVISYNSKALGFSLEAANTLPPILMFTSENDEVIPSSDVIHKLFIGCSHLLRIFLISRLGHLRIGFRLRLRLRLRLQRIVNQI